MQKIAYLKLMIDEARSEGLNNVADLFCDDLTLELAKEGLEF